MKSIGFYGAVLLCNVEEVGAKYHHDGTRMSGIFIDRQKKISRLF
jgi:hypothetical protein